MSTIMDLYGQRTNPLLDDKKDALLDNVIEIEPPIGGETTVEQAQNDGVEVKPNENAVPDITSFSQPKNETVRDVSETNKMIAQNVAVGTPEHEAMLSEAHKILDLPKDLLRMLDTKQLKAEIDHYNTTKNLNAAPNLTSFLNDNPDKHLTQHSNVATLSEIENETPSFRAFTKPGQDTDFTSYGEGAINAIDRGVDRAYGGLLSMAAGIKVRLSEEADMTLGEAAEKNFYDSPYLMKITKDLGLDPTNKADVDKALEHIRKLSPQAYSSILEASGTASMFETIPRAVLNTWFGELIFGTEQDNPDAQKEKLFNDGVNLFAEAVKRGRESQRTNPFSTSAQNFQKLLPTDPDISLKDAALGFADAIAKDPVGGAAFLSEVGLEFTPVIGSAAIVSLATGNPLFGVSVGAGGAFITEQSIAGEARGYIKEKYGDDYDIFDEEGFAKFSSNMEAMNDAITFMRKRGTAISMTQLVQFGIISKLAGKSIGKNTVLQIGTSLTSEGTGEALAQKWSSGKINWNEVVLEVAGGTVTVPIDIATATATWNGVRKDKQATRNWLKTGEMIESKKKKLSQEGKDLIDASEIMAADLKEKGVDEIYLEAEDLKKFDQDRPEGDSVIASLGLDSQAVDEAAGAGQKVAISSDAYIRHIIGVDGFMELHNKSSSISPDGVNGAELEQLEQDEVAAFDEQVNQLDLGPQLGSMNETEQAAAVQETQAIAQNIKEQINRTGNFDSQQAELLALLTAQRYAVRAARASEEAGGYISPMSLFNEDNLVIAGNQNPTEVATTSGAAAVYTTEDIGTVQELRELEDSGLPVSEPTANTQTALEEASSQTIALPVADETGNSTGGSTERVNRIMYYNPIEASQSPTETIIAPQDETGVIEGYHGALLLTPAPTNEGSVPVDMSKLSAKLGVNGNLKTSRETEGGLIFNADIPGTAIFDQDGSSTLRTKRRRQIQQDMSKNGIELSNWTNEEIIQQLNRAAQDEAEEKFQVDQNNPVDLQIGKKKTPAVFPPEQTLSKEGKKKLASFRKDVPGFSSIAKFLQPDEIEVLTKATAKNLVRIFKEFPSIGETAASARAGRAKLGWYRRSKQALDIVFKEDAPRFTALLAALSPQTSVESNLQNALQVWTGWVAAGRPQDVATIKKIMGENVQGDKGDASVLNAWLNNTLIALLTPDDAITLSGPKVNSFSLNLQGYMNEVTNDAWMANWAFIDQGDFSQAGSVRPGKSAGYIAMSVLTRRAAVDANMDPMEVQETIWSMAKALYERASAKGETRTELQILEDGDLTHEMIGDVPDFSTLLNTGIYADVLKEGGYMSQLKDLAAASIPGRSTEKGDVTKGMSKTDLDHLKRTAKRLGELRKQRAWEATTSKIRIGLSSATGTIPGLDNLHKAAINGDRDAFVALQEIAYNALVFHTQGLVDKKGAPLITITKVPSYGFYGGEAEPSLAIQIEMKNIDKPRTLAALARFADMFNQEQIHVREAPAKNKKKVGYQYTDGSFNTSVIKYELNDQLNEQELTKIIDESGLVGFTVGEDGSLLAYYLGDPNDAKAIEEFETAIQRADKLIGSNARKITRTVERLWAYGRGYGATNSYGDIKGNFRPPKNDQANKSAIRLASRLATRTVTPTPKVGELTEAQIQLQTEIMEAYNEMALNNLDNPDVRRAYEELVVELLEQFDTLPVKVEIFQQKLDKDGNIKKFEEPYTKKGTSVASEQMRLDINQNNHLFILNTEPGSFGPPGVVYEDHPLLRDSGRVDINGQPLLMNDLLRAVHDYFAHSMSTVGFGPIGEEAAWRNHMLMTKSPWARWALTSETRGQNSWFNFSPENEGKAVADKDFAEQKVDLLPLSYVTTGEPAVDTTLSQLPGSEGLTLEQTRDTNTGGTFTPKDQITDQNGKQMSLIQIFESADRSTFLHESGHFWLEQLKSDAVEFGGKLDKDWTTVKRWWAGRTEQIRTEAVKRATKAGNKQAAAKIQSMSENQLKRFIMSGDLRGDSTTRYVAVAMHEQFARGFENYLKNGEAPSFTLLDAFTRFAAWMTSVYRAIKRMGGYNGLDVAFSPEVKGVLDRMLATDAEIAAMQEQYKLSAMFETAQEAGMTQKEFNEYRQKAERAKAQMKAKQLSKKLKDIEQAKLDEADARAEELRPDIEAEVAESPIYKLIYELTQGTTPTGGTVETPLGSKISRKMLVDLIGEEGLGKLAKIAGKVVYSPKGIAPGMVANYFGFNDAQQMLQELQNFIPFEQAVNQQIALKLLEEKGPPVTEEDGVNQAVASVHEGDLRSEVIQAELAALRTTEQAFSSKFVKAMAKQRLLNQAVNKVNPTIFLAAQKKHAKAAGKALRQGDKVEAYKHKFQQLVNYEMAKEAIRLKKNIERFKRELIKYKGDRKKHPNIDADYMDRVRGILDMYDLGPRMSEKRRTNIMTEALLRWMAETEQRDGAIFEYPAVLVAADKVKNYNELSYGDFEDLFNSIQTIVKQGRLKKKLLVGKERRDRAAVIAQLVSKLSTRPINKAKKARGKHVSRSKIGKIAEAHIGLANADAALLKVEMLLEMMDNNEPTGIWHQTIFQPFADAQVEEQELLQKIVDRVNKRLEALPKEIRQSWGKRVDVGELELITVDENDGKEIVEEWDRGNLIMLALNTGNESNLEKMIKGETENGRTINREIIDRVLSQLTKQEWEFIQDIWDISEEMFPAIDQIYRNENGRSPARIEPRQIVNQHGTWRGGYFPMMYDPSRSHKGENIEQMDAIQAFQSQTLRASLNSSMTKERSSLFAAPIDFDIARLMTVFNRPIHFLTHYEAVRNANKILKSPEIEKIVSDRVGTPYYNELLRWVGAIATNNEELTPTIWWERTLLATRNNLTVAILGASYTTMAAQLLGYTATIDRLAADTTYGPINIAVVTKDVLNGIRQSISPEARKNVFTLSGEMRNRLENTDRELRAALRTFKGKKGLVNRVSEMAMLAVAGIQMYGVDVPTWIASYNRAMRAEPNNEIGAVRYADRVVRLSQTAGGLKDLSQIQRVKGAFKLFTMFYSFFALLYGITRQITGEVQIKKPLTVARAAARIIVLITLAEAAQSLITGKLPDFDEEDENGNKKYTVPGWLISKTVAGIGSTVPIVRDIVQGKASDYGYSMSPFESFGENFIRSIDLGLDTLDYMTDPDADPEDVPELKRLKSLIVTLNTILGIPGAIQINRTLGAWIAENDEDLDDDLKPQWFDFISGYNEEKAKKRVE